MVNVYLIDTSAFTYKYFYAMPKTFKIPINVAIKKKLNIACGEELHTNALYGFACMIIRLIENDSQATFITCFDKGSKHRKELLSEYKNNRKECPNELQPQFQLIERFLLHMGVQMCYKEGYEADDVIATLTQKYETDEKVENIYITSITVLWQVHKKKLRNMY